MSLLVCPDPDALAEAARTRIEQAARDAIQARGSFHLALAGGSTPARTYARLARGPELPSWHLWFGDERCVPPDDPRSNYGMVAGTGLLSRVSDGHVHRIRGEAGPEEARRYEEELEALLGQAPRLDLVLLGLGTDGHTASLFPGTAALESRSWVTTGIAPTAPHQRITVTFRTLKEARALLFLVAGAEKAAALGRAIAGDPGVPAGRIRPRDGTLAWLVDRAAAPPQASGATHADPPSEAKGPGTPWTG